ncbi:MAG: 4'-phosphopantetheinyl transferase superfamily protein [Muribaculaceae bacterium]|nr:4'-phosphopantetheinyl transferase superfamily protein [Muribaculaceae bacterium]
MSRTLSCGDTLAVIKPLLSYPAVSDTATRHEREHATVQAILKEQGLPTEVYHQPDGSPYLNGYQGFISISHSQESVAIAINKKKRIGIDTETWRPQLERVKHKYLSKRELEIYTGHQGLLIAWCMKEAAYKAAGIKGLELINGISLPDTLTGEEIIITPGALKLKTTLVELTTTSATVLCVPL